MSRDDKNKYRGSLEGGTMDIIIREDSIKISDDKKTLMMFKTDENSLTLQISTNEKDEHGKSKEWMTFYIPESVRPILEAVFVRGLK